MAKQSDEQWVFCLTWWALVAIIRVAEAQCVTLNCYPRCCYLGAVATGVAVTVIVAPPYWTDTYPTVVVATSVPV